MKKQLFIISLTLLSATQSFAMNVAKKAAPFTTGVIASRGAYKYWNDPVQNKNGEYSTRFEQLVDDPKKSKLFKRVIQFIGGSPNAYKYKDNLDQEHLLTRIMSIGSYLTGLGTLKLGTLKRWPKTKVGVAAFAGYSLSRLLLNEINEPDENGKTPLHKALWNENRLDQTIRTPLISTAVPLLLALGSDPNQMVHGRLYNIGEELDDHRHPLELAMNHPARNTIVPLMLAAGAQPQMVKLSKFYSPLLYLNAFDKQRLMTLLTRQAITQILDKRRMIPRYHSEGRMEGTQTGTSDLLTGLHKTKDKRLIAALEKHGVKMIDYVPYHENQVNGLWLMPRENFNKLRPEDQEKRFRELNNSL